MSVVPEIVAVGNAITVTVAVTPVKGVVIVPSETSTNVYTESTVNTGVVKIN